MGREDTVRSSTNQSSRSLRKPPPNLGVGAHSVGPGDFGRVNEGNLNTEYNKQQQQAAAQRITNKEGAVPTTCNIPARVSRKEGDMMSKNSTDRTHEDSSVSCCDSPARIPLEVDHFDRTVPIPVREDKQPWIIPVVLMALTAVLAIVVPCAVILGRDPEPQQRIRATPAPLPIKPNMTLEELHFLVPGLSEATLQKILEGGSGSAQKEALDWVKGDPYDWNAYPNWRKTQRFAMAVIFHAMDGPSWKWSTTDWMAYHVHECNWTGLESRSIYGVDCDEESRLVHLPFRNLNNPRGQLPTEIELLDRLKTIDFSESRIDGPVEKVFRVLLEEGNQDLSRFLPNLQRFLQSGARRRGSIPSWLATLPKLAVLDLRDNGLTSSIPSELGLFTNLESLLLAGNELTGSIPSELNSLSLLTNFTAEDNFLEETPLPGSFCSNKEPMLLLTTDWCQGSEKCCSS